MKLTEFRKEFRDFLKENELSQSQIAKALSSQENKLSTTQLSQILNGKYPIQNRSEEVLKQLSSYIANYSKVKIEKQIFVETSDFQMSNYVVEKIISNRKIGMLFGLAGTGKTTVTKKIVEKYPNATLIECSSTINPKSLIAEISKGLNLKIELKGTVGEKFNQLIETLKGKDSILFFDEAEYLNKRGLEIVRRINDLTQIPVILVGTEILHSRLYNGGTPEFRQLYSRISRKWEFMPSHFNREENIKTLRLLVKAYIGDVEESILKKICQATNGLPRDIVNLLTAVKEDWSEEKITLQHLESTIFTVQLDQHTRNRKCQF
jgi:DNA transposition AAA+ family ATPase